MSLLPQKGVKNVGLGPGHLALNLSSVVHWLYGLEQETWLSSRVGIIHLPTLPIVGMIQ